MPLNIFFSQSCFVYFPHLMKVRYKEKCKKALKELKNEI